MEHWLNLLLDNKEYVLVGILLIGGLFWDKLPSISGIVTWVKTRFNKQLITVVDDDCMTKDMNAIKYLAQRAIELNDLILLKEMKSINAKFFDSHCKLLTDNRKSATK